MTAAQEKAAERIRKYVQERDVYSDSREVKTFEVTETDHGSVEVYSVAGMKDDDGTLAAVFCRDTRQIFIGERGGLTAYLHKNGKTKTLKGWVSVMACGRRT